jgi:hypothetical protein
MVNNQLKNIKKRGLGKKPHLKKKRVNNQLKSMKKERSRRKTTFEKK